MAEDLMLNSPAQILARFLIQEGGGNAPPSQTWPVYSTSEPDGTSIPDNVITVFDTTGIAHGRSQIDGELFADEGVQVRVRAASHLIGWAKARELRQIMAENIYHDTLSINGTAYKIWAVNRISNVIVVGQEQTTQRRIFTINATVTVERVTSA